ncbi:MAG: sugar phosphate isomerase/epimerase [Verrucomicrobia bacterium]|nr:sugar phosphate isomerase/epimerase [Verrucomicrobiota bacterium]
MEAAGVRHLEIAPTRIWPDLATVTEYDARDFAEKIHARGFSICAFQALLFGKPDLHVFGEDKGRACLDHLAKVCRLANWMGARALVFGSPKNRLRGALSIDEANVRAREFFRAAGDRAAVQGVVICIEPNPDIYGCDFLQSAAETASMVRAVDSPGIRMNLDMGELIHHGSDAACAVSDFLPLVGHFHVSEPMLAPFDDTRAAHRAAAMALKEAGYAGIVSLEMKAPPDGLPVVQQALHKMLRVYFSTAS